MAAESISCWEFYTGWEEYQRLLVGAVAPLTDAHLRRSIASDLRSIGRLATHLVRTRAAWLHGVLGEGGPEVAAIAAWDDNAGEAPPAAELVRGLEVTFAAWKACLQRWTPRDLDAAFHDGPDERTRGWVIWHVIEHDLHHGGELSTRSAPLGWPGSTFLERGARHRIGREQITVVAAWSGTRNRRHRLVCAKGDVRWPGDHSPVSRCRPCSAATPPRIAALTAGLAADQLRATPTDGEWAANEVLAHLRACADVWGSCMVTMIAQDRPTLRAVNPRTWIRKTEYREQEFQPSLHAFTTQRTEVLAVLIPLAPEGWSRAATVTGAGTVSTRTSPAPYITVARMCFLPARLGCLVVRQARPVRLMG